MRRVILTTDPSVLERRVCADLSRFVIGQDRAKEHIARMYLAYHSGIRNPRGPAGCAFLLGPTGVGKTELVQSFAEMLFGDKDGYTHVSCGNFMTDREVWTLLGSPKGHIGSDVKPRFSQELIDAPDARHKAAQIKEIDERITALEAEARSAAPERRMTIVAKLESFREELAWVKNSGFVSIVLLDEFEKAHYSLQDATLDLLDKGNVRLNSNGEARNERHEKVDHLAENEKLTTNFKNTFVFFTSNAASDQIEKMVSGKRFGFQLGSAMPAGDLDQRIYDLAIARLKKRLLPELFGRIAKENMIVCHALSEEETMGIVELQIENFRALIAASNKPFRLSIDPAVKEYLLRESRDESNIVYGGRAAVNVVKKRIMTPLNTIIAKDRKEQGIDKDDAVLVELGPDGKPCFVRLEADDVAVAKR